MMVRAYSVGCSTPFKMQGFLRASYRRVGVISATLLRNYKRPWEVLTGHGYWNSYGCTDISRYQT